MEVQYLGGSDMFRRVEPCNWLQMRKTQKLRSCIDLSSQSGNFQGLPLILKQKAFAIYHENIYCLEEEGLYRFFDVQNKTIKQVYLYIGDVYLFLGFLSVLYFVHGYRHDDVLNGSDLKNVFLKSSKLSITCGTKAVLTCKMLESLSIRSRLVSTLTLDDWNSWDNGHTGIELYDTSLRSWVFYDADLGCKLKYDNKYVNVGQLCRLYKSKNNLYMLEAEYPWGHTQVDNYTDRNIPDKDLFFSLLCESIFLCDKARHEWYKRVMQVPIISGFFPSDSAQEASRVLSYPSITYTGERLVKRGFSWESWENLFYGFSGKVIF